MRTKLFLVISTFLFNSFTAAVTEFKAGKDNYEFKTTITNGQVNGFTIEYKDYYKVVHNVITNQKYCLVGWNQPLPSDCSLDSTFNAPIKGFNFDSDSYVTVPYIELLGLQSNISGTVAIANIASPCIQDGSQNVEISRPEMILSTKSVGAQYVSFSGHDESLGPLERASWLLYLGAFFDLEMEAFAAYSQISNNYNCHKNNLGYVRSPKIVSWTSFDAVKKSFTIHGDNYFTQLSSDAGGVLRAPNRLQDNSFSSAVVTELHALALDLHGAEYIFDISNTSVDYSTWYTSGGIYFTPTNSYAHIEAIANTHVYTTHGLLSSNGISDWTQRSSARPDLALLDLIRLLYPSFELPDPTLYPVWFNNFESTDHRTINTETYGNCSSIIKSASIETMCTIGTGVSHAKTLTSGGKAGVSLGVIIFVFLASGLGIWLYRRYRRNKRHNFYRMNEL